MTTFIINIFILLVLLRLTKATNENLELSGPNVCTRSESIVIFTQENVYEDKRIKVVPKTKSELRNYSFCCNGYKQNLNNCIPMCNMTCGYGFCHKPNVCKCDSGFEGLTCNKIDENRCQKIKTGIENCTLSCQCRNGGVCNNNKCVCEKGFNGNYCIERICPANMFGINCTRNCNCTENQICNPVDGECKVSPEIIRATKNTSGSIILYNFLMIIILPSLVYLCK